MKNKLMTGGGAGGTMTTGVTNTTQTPGCGASNTNMK